MYAGAFPQSGGKERPRRFLAILGNGGWVILLFLVVALHKAILRYFFGTVIVSKDQIGIVNKKWVLFGKNRTLPDGAIVASNGEAGLQADALAPDIHFGLWAWQYAVVLAPFTTIDKNQIGIVEARDGKSLSSGRVLAKSVECNSFQDARKFLSTGGERGPQISIIPSRDLPNQHGIVCGCRG